jgi:uncharacterized membrane protein
MNSGILRRSAMSFNQDLQKEINRWLKEGLISLETAEVLRERYPTAKKSMTQTLAVLGSILIGVGVILFFAANWEAMSRAAKVLVVVLSFTLAYCSGYYLAYVRKDYTRLGQALIFLGSILYGSAIWLIAQIFHLEAEAGLGFFLWYLGVIPVAWLFNSSLNLALASVNLVAWFLAGKYPLSLPFLLFPLLLGSTILPLAIIKRDRFNFTAVIVAAYIWFIPLGVKLAHTNYSFPLGIVSLLLLSLILYYLVKNLSGKGFFAENFLLVLSFLGLFIGFAPFTFHDFLREFSRSTNLYQFPYLVAGSLAVTAFLKFRDRTLKLSDLPLFFMLYPCLYLFFPLLGENMPFLVLNNILFFVYALLVIYYGYQMRRPFIFNLSLLMFAAAVVMKYFDVFFALMPRSVFFMSGGLLLLVGSIILEHQRRKILKTMERGETR